MISKIDSLQNPKIKLLASLIKSSKARCENGCFVLEGLRLCLDTDKSDVTLKSVFFTERCFEKNGDDVMKLVSSAESAYIISESAADKISDTQHSQGIFCLCKTGDEVAEDSITNGKKYVALDNVQNPDNLGAVSRVAEAMGVDALIVSSGCDKYNSKALRSSMGSLLRLPVIKTNDLPKLLKRMNEQGVKVYATVPDGTAQKITQADMSGGVICVIGNEANGISEEVKNVCSKITIPMMGRTESLNAATAAAITIWEMMR